MKVAAICTLSCLAFATSGGFPHGSFRLKRAAVKALAWSQERGGEIFNEFLLGRHQEADKTTYDSRIQEDFKEFIRKLSSQVTTLQRQAEAQARPRPIGRRQEDTDRHDHGHRTQHQQEGVHRTVDFHDILVILGDYSKSMRTLPADQPWAEDERALARSPVDSTRHHDDVQHASHQQEGEHRATDFNNILVILGDYTKSLLRNCADRLRDGDERVQRRDPNHGNGRFNPHAPRGLVLPAGTDLWRLDFNDILGILGDYLKSFSEFLAPHLLQLASRRGGLPEVDEISASVQEILSAIDQIKSLNLQ